MFEQISRENKKHTNYTKCTWSLSVILKRIEEHRRRNTIHNDDLVYAIIML